MNRLICFLIGHDWDKVHGYRDAPDFGAICERCRKQSETEKQWLERTGQV